VGCTASSDPDETGSAEEAQSSKACHWKCGHCPKGVMCTLACTASGNCGTTCTQTMLCIQGYVWDDKSCSCVPGAGAGGVACGNGTCGSGEYCCNSSCGICAPRGAMCTQQVCATTL
jgi:hypothetical protein